MENPKVEVIVRSWVNFDGYECEGKQFVRTEVGKLKEQVAGREVVWTKGRNTFAGRTVSDKFLARMIMNYVEQINTKVEEE